MTDKNDNQKHKNTSPGVMLLKARQARHLSVEHMAKQLNLSQEIIEALEEDRFESLPAPIFVRGYIRTYCAMVGISDDKVLEHYNIIVGENEPSASLSTIRMSEMVTEGGVRWKKLLPVGSLVLVIVLAAIVWLSMEPGQEPTANNNLESSTTSTAADETAQNDTILPLNKVLAPGDVQPEPDVVEEKKPEVPVAKTVVIPETSRDKITNKQGNGLDQLVFEFSDDSWVDVRDSLGNRLIFDMVRAGKQYSVSGKPPFKLTLGNARKVKLTRNGRVVDLTPYIRGNVAKFSLGKIAD